MKRLFLVLAVLLALLLPATATTAQPVTCSALVLDDVAAQAAQELRHYASDIQSDTFQDQTMGHVMQLLALAEQLDEAPRYGCFERVTPPPAPPPPPPPTVRGKTCAVSLDGATRNAAVTVINDLTGAALRTDGYMVDLRLLQEAQRVRAALEAAPGVGCEVTR